MTIEVTEVAPLAPRPRPEPREWPLELDPAAHYDGLGRKQPHRLHFLSFARGVPGFAARFAKQVPDQFVARVGVDEYDIACPCGRTPHLHELGIGACECGRMFALVGGVARVGYPGDE